MSPTPTLANILSRFNRKERNLLFRAALGYDKVPQLDAGFRQQIKGALGIEPGPDSWWSTDYHINWLVGALFVFAEGINALKTPRENCRDGFFRLIEGNQEDVDMIIVDGLDMILIEAKAFEAWDDDQLRRKLARLDLIQSISTKLMADRNPDDRVRLHFLLISPTTPPPSKVTCPNWVLKQNKSEKAIPWIELKYSMPDSILDVARCDHKGTVKAAADYWRIRERKRIAGIQ